MLNFKIPAKSFQGIFLKAQEGIAKCSFEYDKRVIQKGDINKDIKNKWGFIWTGDLNVSPFKEKDFEDYSGKENNFSFDGRLTSFSPYDDMKNSDFVESICAFGIDKFAAKNLTDKLKIKFSKKYY